MFLYVGNWRNHGHHPFAALEEEKEGKMNLGLPSWTTEEGNEKKAWKDLQSLQQRITASHRKCGCSRREAGSTWPMQH